MTSDGLLLDDSLRRKLDQMMLVASKVRPGAIKGERRSTRRGTSIEFADYRNYAPGDDLRRLDWNVYARLERPYIKLLEDEEDLAVHVVLDASASMDFPREGEPDAHKFLYARRLFAALAYVALVSNDRLMLTAVSDAGMEHFGPARGRSQAVQMLRWAHDLKPRGVTDLNLALRDYAMRTTRPGLTFVISDMFSPTGFVDGVNALLGKGHEIVILHVLSPEEVNPPLSGDLRLIDVESGKPQEVSLDSGLRDLYMRHLAGWQNDIRAECARRNVNYLSLVSGDGWERVILYDLRRLNIIK
jgi:uncharacterized protein (DUF58 family)